MTRKEIFAEIRAMSKKDIITDLGITIPEAKRAEIESIINEKFVQYTESIYARITKNIRENDGYTPEEAAQIIAKRKKEFSAFSLSDKIAELANNFRLRWPGGYNRHILSAHYQQLIEDLDRIISEKGYENVPVLIDGDRLSKEAYDQRCLIIADVFLAMLSLGYSREELAE